MRTTHLPASHCPHCDQVVDATTSLLDDSRPKPGDLSVCFHCGGFLFFDQQLYPQALTRDAVLQLEPYLQQQLFSTRLSVLSTPR